MSAETLPYFGNDIFSTDILHMSNNFCLVYPLVEYAWWVISLRNPLNIDNIFSSQFIQKHNSAIHMFSSSFNTSLIDQIYCALVVRVYICLINQYYSFFKSLRTLISFTTDNELISCVSLLTLVTSSLIFYFWDTSSCISTCCIIGICFSC